MNMYSERPGCVAQRHNDQLICGACGLAWDANDPEPPKCNPALLARRLEAASEPPECRNRPRKPKKTGPTPSPIPKIEVTVERRLETVGLPVAELIGPMLDLAFCRALEKAGIGLFSPTSVSSFAELDIAVRQRDLSFADTRYVAERFGVLSSSGPTAYTAGARCFVRSVFGPTIKIRMAE